MNWNGETLFDYGCGSGVLAVAALRLGAGHAWGLDNDPQALIATHRTLQRNGVLAQTRCSRRRMRGHRRATDWSPISY